MPDPTPMDIFETVRAKALTILKMTFMETERSWPGDDSPEVIGMFMPLLGIGVAAASEHYAQHPEHLALAGSPICVVCREPIQTLQVGVDPAPESENTGMVSVAWPCGHFQHQAEE